MDYPHGHHNRREEEHHPTPPPPQVHHTSHAPPVSNPHPPPPQVHHTSHAPPVYTVNNPHPPQVQHTSHVGPGPTTHSSPAPAPPHVAADTHHRPQAPAASSHNTHGKKDELANKPTVRMYCKAETNYSLTIRDGKVVLAPSNSADLHQHWIKDEKFSTRVKDEEGYPSFALVNKATGQAIKHSVGATQPVELTHYNSNALDESVLWTESKDLGDSYRAIRMVSNIRLNVDAFNGDQKHGGVHDGTRIVLWEWKKDSNQRWKIVPYCLLCCVHSQLSSMKSSTSKKGSKSWSSKCARRFCFVSDKVKSGDNAAIYRPVYLNVYDITPMNAYVYWAGLGIFHTGVEVDGIEYAFFGEHDSSSSRIFEVDPRRCPGRYKFRRSIQVGNTSLDGTQIRELMESQGERYVGDSYRMITNNCNHFCEDTCYKLTEKKIPGWVNRLARLGSMYSCLLPEPLQNY